jgi:hypothetical protein
MIQKITKNIFLFKDKKLTEQAHPTPLLLQRGLKKVIQL